MKKFLYNLLITCISCNGSIWAMNALKAKQEQVGHVQDYANALFELQEYAYKNIKNENFGSTWASKKDSFQRKYPTASPKLDDALLKKVLMKIYSEKLTKKIEEVFAPCVGKSNKDAWDEAYKIVVKEADTIYKYMIEVLDLAKKYEIQEYINGYADFKIKALKNKAYDYAFKHYEEYYSNRQPITSLKSVTGGRVGALRELKVNDIKTINAAWETIPENRPKDEFEEIIKELLNSGGGSLSMEEINKKIAEKRQAKRNVLQEEGFSQSKPTTPEEKHLADLKDKLLELDDIWEIKARKDDGSITYRLETMDGQRICLAETYLAVLEDMKKFKTAADASPQYTGNIFKKFIAQFTPDNFNALDKEFNLYLTNNYPALKNISYAWEPEGKAIAHIVAHNLGLEGKKSGNDSDEDVKTLKEKARTITIEEFNNLPDAQARALFGKSVKAKKSVYKVLSQIMHPDKNPDNKDNAEKAFKKIGAIYASFNIH